MYRTIVISISAIIVLLLGATAIHGASERSLPGDALYTVKTDLEDAQLSATTDVDAKAELNMKFAEKRLAEIQSLAEQTRFEDIMIASTDMEAHLSQAAQQANEVAQTDPETAAALNDELASLVAQQAKVFGALSVMVPSEVTSVFLASPSNIVNVNVNDNADDNGDVDTNSNENENGNVNENGDDNSNGNENDNGNTNDNTHENENGDDNGNENEDNDNDDDDHDDDDDNDHDENENGDDQGHNNDNDD